MSSRWISREGVPEFVPRKGDRWLFLVPHDDDAVIGAALAIQSGLESGVEVNVAITSDGSLGYCDYRERDTIAETRERETREALSLLGDVAPRFLGFPDGNLFSCRLEIQRSFSRLFRELRPQVLFICSGSDLHPDHKVVHEDALISLFHASGAIWPELGPPLETLPDLLEFPVYCALPGDPHYRMEGNAAAFGRKLSAIAAYRSQRQIESLVAKIRDGGAREYFRRHSFDLYDPRMYDHLFIEEASGGNA